MPYPIRARTITALAFGLACGLAATQAQARPQPTPPPSGIVVHLFGPDSLSSHILPSGPAAPGSQGNAASGTPTTGATPTAAPESSPSWGDVAHQMFVTGDPAQENAAALSKGKTGIRP